MTTLFIMKTEDDYGKPIDLKTKGIFMDGDSFINPNFSHIPCFESKNTTYNAEIGLNSVYVYKNNEFIEQSMSCQKLSDFYHFLSDFSEIILAPNLSYDSLDIDIYKLFLNNKEFKIKNLPISICWPDKRLSFENYIRFNPDFAAKVKRMYFDYFFEKEMIDKFNFPIKFSKLLILLQAMEAISSLSHTPVYILMNKLYKNNYAHPSEISDQLIELYMDNMLENYENPIGNLNSFIAKDEDMVRLGESFSTFYESYEKTKLKLTSDMMMDAYCKRVESIDEVLTIIDELLFVRKDDRSYV